MRALPGLLSERWDDQLRERAKSRGEETLLLSDGRAKARVKGAPVEPSPRSTVRTAARR